MEVGTLPTLTLVPTEGQKTRVLNGTLSTMSDSDLVEWFQDHDPAEYTVLGPMGGRGDALFSAALKQGFPVYRVPVARLQEAAGLTRQSTPDERVAAIVGTWTSQPDAFYPITELNETVLILRELTRVRNKIQGVYRKPAQLQYQAAFRDLQLLLPEDAMRVNLRRTFAEPSLVSGAKADEKELEAQIKQLIKPLPIWQAISSRDGLLPRVKGIGPVLGATIIGEIGDIRRFPSSSHLRAYARYHVDGEGSFPRKRRGQVANWNDYLGQAVWQWANSQLLKAPPQDGEFAPFHGAFWLFYYEEQVRHPQVEEFTNAQGRTRKRYTNGHIKKRAERKVGSALLEYIFDLWTAIEAGRAPEVWFRNSAWAERFERYDMVMNVRDPLPYDIIGPNEQVIDTVDNLVMRGEELREARKGITDDEPQDNHDQFWDE